MAHLTHHIAQPLIKTKHKPHFGFYKMRIRNHTLFSVSVLVGFGFFGLAFAGFKVF
jgi:hypothetical protein